MSSIARTYGHSVEYFGRPPGSPDSYVLAPPAASRQCPLVKSYTGVETRIVCYIYEQYVYGYECITIYKNTFKVTHSPGSDPSLPRNDLPLFPLHLGSHSPWDACRSYFLARIWTGIYAKGRDRLLSLYPRVSSKYRTQLYDDPSRDQGIGLFSF